MPELAVDLGSPKFWLFFAVALLLLMPIASASVKRYAFAALNLCFIAALLKLPGIVFAGGFVLAVWAAARVLPRPSLRGAGVAVALIVLGAMFFVHKLPPLAVLGGPGAKLKTLLAGVGFSFVLLRTIELLRASAEEAFPPPSLAQVVGYLLPFHMLAAGPIQAYDEFARAELVPPPLRVSGVLQAAERVTSGLFKKFVLAQALKTVFLTGFEADGAYFFFEAQVYYVWVYLDFSAYSDIAVGIGQLLGIRTPENFQRPLTARNIIEFWERWHISLSLFIRRNVFVPLQLGLMRRFEGAPLLTACSAFTVAFLLCGAWHGLNVRCLGWGAIHALGLVACTIYKSALQKRLGRKRLMAYLDDKRIRVLSTFITFEFVAFSLVFISYPFK